MIYLVQQIVLCLLFTAMIGAAMGWLLRGLGTARQTEAVEARWRTRLVQAEQRAATQPPDAPASARKMAVTAPPDTASDQATGTTPASATDEQLETLRQRLAASERELATLRTAEAVRAQADAPGETDKEQLRETRIMAQQLQSSLLEQRSANDQLEKRLERIEQDKTTLVERLREAESRNAQLTQERQHAMDTVTNLQRDMRGLRNTADEQRAAASRATAQLAARNSAADKAPRASQSPQQRLPIAETAEPAAPPYEPDWQLAAPEGKADNLQAIYGIGPKTEKRLHALGIFHFRQLGGFKKRDIVWLTQHLHGIPGRISRDRWVEQAGALEKRRLAGQPI